MIAALLLIIPLIAAAIIPFAPARQAKWIALLGTAVACALSLIGAVGFEHWRDGGFGLTLTDVGFASDFGITLKMGADSVALLLILLTTILLPLCVWSSFTAISERVPENYAWMLVIETAMVGVFLARDLIFFYVCFELTLVPMFFLIAIYGGENRARAAYKFFIYTFTGSLIALAGLVYVAWKHAAAHNGDWSFDIGALTQTAMGMDTFEQGWVLLALLAGFAVKVPLFPLHTWLPLAHTEAPTAGSVILAAVLLKLGTYGLYRFVLPMVPVAVVQYAPLIAVLCIIGIIYAALICWVQSDVKRLVAYSSVSHLGFCVLGLVALNPLGVQGSVLYMLNHGLSTGALFLLIGMIYERYHTRDMDKIGGLSKRMPVWAFFMVFFVLSSVGLPGLNGFVSEFYCLIATFTSSRDNAQWPGMLGPWYAAVAATGMIFAAMYLLMMTGKVVWGPLKEPNGHGHGHGHAHEEAVTKLPADLTPREIAILAPIAAMCLYLGFQPSVITDTMEKPIETALAAYPDIVNSQPRVASAQAPSTALSAQSSPAGGRAGG